MSIIGAQWSGVFQISQPHFDFASSLCKSILWFIILSSFCFFEKKGNFACPASRKNPWACPKFEFGFLAFWVALMLIRPTGCCPKVTWVHPWHTYITSWVMQAHHEICRMSPRSDTQGRLWLMQACELCLPLMLPRPLSLFSVWAQAFWVALMTPVVCLTLPKSNVRARGMHLPQPNFLKNQPNLFSKIQPTQESPLDSAAKSESAKYIWTDLLLQRPSRRNCSN